MRKNIFFLFTVIMILVACKSRSNEKKSGTLAGFSSYYNTLFNSKDALETELRARKSAYVDNFYAPYITLLQYDEQPLGAEIGDASFFGDNPSFVPKGTGSSKSASVLQISEAKALKAINKYSVLKDGEEKNKQMFNAHLLLAQSRLYMNKPLEALEALNYIFSNMKKDKRINLARIYQAQAYAKMKNYYRANEIFLALKNEDLKSEYQKLYTVYYSEMLLAAGKKEEAAAQLDEAFSSNKNRELRSRIAFLRGQILADLGKNEEARESFITAYKFSNDFEFEVKSQIEIAKTFNGAIDDYEGAKKYLEDISRKGTYASRKNEFYYALGLMANKAGKTEEAQEFFNKAKSEKVSDPQIRGLTYYEIGKFYADRNDYISAGAYYDSALAVMSYEPSKQELTSISRNIKDVSRNYYLIKKNDSILALSKMPEDEKRAFFNRYIEGIKAKEAMAEAEKKKSERNKGFNTGDYDANSVFANSRGNNFQDFGNITGGKSGFYFANSNTVSKGQSEFRQIWGNRSLVDDWRFSNRSASIEDVRNEALGLETVQNPRRFEPEFYIEKIPTDALQLQALKKDRDTASLGLGRMYENYFSDTELATKTLYDLVDNNPEQDVKLQALYRIFAMNYEKNPTAAERAKAMILSEFPYTSYAEFVKNPKSTGFSKSTTDVEKLYTDAFNLYTQEKYSESQALITQAIEKYPKDALVPKFTLLNAFNTGKTAGKEIMILQLEQLALSYPKTSEGIKAAQMLQYLKSDLQMVPTDEAGNQTGFPDSGRPENAGPVSQKERSQIGRPESNGDN
ncbi:type IX secretion system periplasmic lipoprotein PorW/SprE [Chryseobacterium taklimakanense]|uniref:Tetratricopeptide repeat protein n=1 Tax=Chryseobacterium taklimakanense TaxID=536441 RepID=A0A3G8WZQ4_9FLAO|nr:tetratricopeptide repeat protein [Chryseobacterium taklimakanense]AZI21266.1 tetratricopeptide repeat protein [Chryseobacterium taklimakanense]